jgi:hypothetical protein
LPTITLRPYHKSVKAGNQTLADLSQAKAGVSTAEFKFNNRPKPIGIIYTGFKAIHGNAAINPNYGRETRHQQNYRC